jgi:hypothetical protein
MQSAYQLQYVEFLKLREIQGAGTRAEQPQD